MERGVVAVAKSIGWFQPEMTTRDRLRLAIHDALASIDTMHAVLILCFGYLPVMAFWTCLHRES